MSSLALTLTIYVLPVILLSTSNPEITFMSPSGFLRGRIYVLLVVQPGTLTLITSFVGVKFVRAYRSNNLTKATKDALSDTKDNNNGVQSLGSIAIFWGKKHNIFVVEKY